MITADSFIRDLIKRPVLYYGKLLFRLIAGVGEGVPLSGDQSLSPKVEY